MATTTAPPAPPAAAPPPSSASSAQKPILISGAGLASLLLAQALLRAGIPFQIFERDADVSFRAQGYRLRLSSEGLDAIEAVLGPDKFARFWRKCGKTLGAGIAFLNAVTGEELKEEEGLRPTAEEQKEDAPPPPLSSAPPSSPDSAIRALASRDGKVVGISRGDMRRLFLDGCEAHVRWSHRVTGYEMSEGGESVRAVFADGSRSEEGALLVGGEGISSHVAKQLSNGALKVYDTGARGIHGQAPVSAFKALGEGVWLLRDDSNPAGRVFAITNVRPARSPSSAPSPSEEDDDDEEEEDDEEDPNQQLGWTMGAAPGVIQLPTDSASSSSPNAMLGTPAAQLAQSLTANWHPRVLPLFAQMDAADAAFWKITCSTPTGVPHWTNNPRVTVIGDAAHSMTPAGGIGANTAVRDSALLGRLIVESKGEMLGKGEGEGQGERGQEGGEGEGEKEGPRLGGVTAEYERVMRGYASEAVRASYGMARRQFGVEIGEGTPTV